MRAVRAEQGVLEPFFSRVLLERLSASTDPEHFEIDGSVVFVDVSGFTALSERLARRGREGAEYITEAIERCFGPLLDVVGKWGGHLLKFGGDALLLLFEGTGHELIACAAAAEMQRTMRTAGRIELPGARVTLRMSVGVHTGPLQLFVVGESHRELVVAGAAASAVVGAEHVASAGQIVVTPSTAAALDPGLVGEPLGPGALLLRSPELESGVTDLRTHTPVPDDLTMAAVPVGLRGQLRSLDQSPEHRMATIAFLHFDGTDDLIANEGADVAAEALHELVTVVQQAVDELEVCFLATDVDDNGGKIILSAGVPTNTGNDEERMLFVLGRIVETDLRLPVRIGVNRGAVFAGPVGPPQRRTYTVMGDTVNLAARLMARAEPGQLLSSSTVLDEAGTGFETSMLEPFKVKGKAQPVQAFAVGKVLIARRADGPVEEFPLFGREPERALLRGALEAARTESVGRLIDLVGESGIGKSRLVEDLRGAASDLPTFRVMCESYAATTPYHVWRDALRQVAELRWEDPPEVVAERLVELVADRAPELEPWLPLIGLVIDVDLPSTPEVDELHPDVLREKLCEVVGSFLEAVIDGPALFEFDDAHWMDEASCVLLDHLAAGATSRAWLLCVMRQDDRGGFAPRSGVESALQLELTPLDRTDAVELALLASATDPLTPGTLELVVDRSGGNPQFLRDLLDAASNEDDELPDSVESAAVAAIDRLDPDDRTLVRRASLLGVTFHPDLMNAVLPESVAMPGPDTWRRLGVLFEAEDDGYLRFRREIVRDAAYGGLPYRLRRELHSRVARRIQDSAGETESRAESLSLHFHRAGEADQAWRYSTLAGDRALARHAAYDATRFYRRALDVASSLSPPELELAAVWERLGDACDKSGQFDRAQEALTSARRHVGDEAVQQARLLERHAIVAEHAGRFVSAVRWTKRGLRVLGDDGPESVRQRARLLAGLATIRMRQRRLGDAMRLSREAIDLAERVQELPALARAYQTLEVALVEAGLDTDGAAGERALQLFIQLGDLVGQSAALNNMGGIAYWAGRWDEAVTLYDRATEASTRAGTLANAAFGDFGVGEILIDQGLVEQGAARVRRAEQVWRGVGDDHGVAFAAALLARAALRAGEIDDAYERYEHAVAEHTRLHSDADAQLARVESFECLLAVGRSEEVLGLVDELLAVGEGELTFVVPLLRRVRGLALSQMGEVPAGRLALLDATSAAFERSSLFEAARSLDALCAITAAWDPERAAWTASRDAIFEQLGVVMPPPLPDGLRMVGRSRHVYA